MITHSIFLGAFSFNSVVLQRCKIFSRGEMAIEIVGKKYGSVGLFFNYEGDTIIEVWLQLSLDSTHPKRFKAHSNESSWAVPRVENLY